ncbi:hypothetical protein BA059_05005 [Mycolicibacterium sp. (ex Dasyatis americana)]|nr:hypothetical protein BA059_05005 [Mycolicibacterium sp. (ex Dasyatis americana)]
MIAFELIVSIPVQLLAPNIVSRFGHRTVMATGSLTLAPALPRLHIWCCRTCWAKYGPTAL